MAARLGVLAAVCLALAFPAQAQKVSALPAASTPFSGLEFTPIVQDGITKRAAIGDILGNTSAATLTSKTINCANNTCVVRLGLDVTGTLPIANGGTGQTTYTPNDLAPTAASLSSLHALYFDDHGQLTGARVRLALSGTVSDASGSFRDTMYFESTDSDTTVYTQAHTNYAGRFAAFGPNPSETAGGFQNTTKNIVGLSAYCKARNDGTPLATGQLPGCSGINVDAIQFGEGISDNELSATNVSAAGGGFAHSKSMAAVQAIINSNYAAADATHTAYAVLASNTGTFASTAAYGADSGSYLDFIRANSGVTVSRTAIVMPSSAANFVGTMIDYGSNNGNPAGGSWTDWMGDVNGGQYRWVDGGVIIAQLDTEGFVLSTANTFNGFAAQPVSGAGNNGFTLVGSWANGMSLGSATITNAGIVLNTSGAGSTIMYDGSNYTNYNSGVYQIATAGVVRVAVNAAGLTTLSKLAVTQESPAAAAACTAGQIVGDTGFLYVCSASGAWKRVAVTGGF